MDLIPIAERVMRAHGFEPDMPPAALDEAAALTANPPHVSVSDAVEDLRALPWSSIDNDDSRDLDQIEVAESIGGGKTRVRIGIADVDVFVRQSSAIDRYAAAETTSVYAGVRTFPMLPHALSTGATSLNESGDRAAIVTEFVVTAEGDVIDGRVYRALVRNHARLTYNAVGDWLDGRQPPPPALRGSADLAAQVRLQDTVAQALRRERYRNGALDIETKDEVRSRASELIEDFMIAANGVVARALEQVSSIRRIVRTPKRWDRIVTLASGMGGSLPATPDSKALNDFLASRRTADPEHFVDLSLSVIKLMGPGEYVLERPGDAEQGHFGLAVEDYTHSTAPNRRFADLVTQRVVKALIAGARPPYSDDALATIASNCTTRADAARKVEREMAKRIAAQALHARLGEEFDAIVTGASAKGTFVRVQRPHVEGMLVHGKEGLDVGDRVRVKLVKTDVASGFIDFVRVR